MVTAGHKRKMSRLTATTLLKMLRRLQEVRTSKGIKIARLVPKLSIGGRFVSHQRVIPIPNDLGGKFHALFIGNQRIQVAKQICLPLLLDLETGQSSHSNIGAMQLLMWTGNGNTSLQ